MYKEHYNYSIILVKEGIFYKTYSDDALILWYLFEYKYINNCTSFGINSYDKVLDKLRHLDLAFLVCSKDNIIEKTNGDFDNYKLIQILKDNVSSIFNAETFIIGLLSGFIGVVISSLLTVFAKERKTGILIPFLSSLSVREREEENSLYFSSIYGA